MKIKINDEKTKDEFLSILEKLNKFYTEEFSWGKMLFNQDFPIILKKEE